MEPGGRAAGLPVPGTGLLGGCLQPLHRRCVGCWRVWLLLRPGPLPSPVQGKKLHVSSRQVTRCSPGENDLFLLVGPSHLPFSESLIIDLLCWDFKNSLF